jgi:hypothetical protein
MEETLKKYGISKQLFLKVTEFIKLQVDLGMINTLTDQEQIAAEILIMASEGIKLKTSNDKCNLASINNSEAMGCEHKNYSYTLNNDTKLCDDCGCIFEREN